MEFWLTGAAALELLDDADDEGADDEDVEKYMLVIELGDEGTA